MKTFALIGSLGSLLFAGTLAAQVPGAAAPGFAIADTEGRPVKLAEFRAKR